MEVNIRKVEAMPLACVRHVGPYEECKPAWEKICAWAGPKGLLGPDTTFIGIYHDDPNTTPKEQLRSDACITCAGTEGMDGEVKTGNIPAGEYAVYRHVGPYDKLKDSWDAMVNDWLPSSGKKYKEGTCFEMYMNDPETTPPEELITDIYLPVE